MRIGGTTVQREAEPGVTEAERNIGRHIIGVCDVTIRNSRTVQVHITNLVVIAGVHTSTEIPTVQGIKTDIE